MNQTSLLLVLVVAYATYLNDTEGSQCNVTFDLGFRPLVWLFENEVMYS